MTGPIRRATVLGGSGFLGREVVACLAARGLDVRVAVRHPERVSWRGPAARVEAIAADVHDAAAVRAALDGAQAAVNAVSLYVERDTLTFDAVHVQAAERIARAASDAGLERLVHISGIGADKNGQGRYVRSRGEGEDRVRGACDRAVVLRPSVMVGRDDSLLAALDRITAWAPVVPMFGDGHTRLQPVFVGDVAAAAAAVASDAERATPTVYELGGPEILTYRELIERLLDYRRRRRALLPVPFPAWQALTGVAERLPGAPLTRGQVELMRADNVVGEAAGTFADLDIEPRALGDLLPDCLP